MSSMSHGKIRTEKDCLNCGAIVTGRFCSRCGQENVVTQQKVWPFIIHFINDITHFDGKFFWTLRILLFHPGVLTRQFIQGRRASFLDPVRMYLFTSFIFFLVFIPKYEMVEPRPAESVHLEVDKSLVNVDADFSMDSAGIAFSSPYRSLEEYDSLYRAGKVKENWWTRKINRKKLELNSAFEQRRPGEVLSGFYNQLIHQFPKLLFASLPFTALLLYLLHYRNKSYYYVAHGIFTLHFFITVFIVLLVDIGIDSLIEITGWKKLDFLHLILFLFVLFYLYKAMRNFYGESRLTTILKYIVFLFLFLILNVFLFGLFGILSVFQI